DRPVLRHLAEAGTKLAERDVLRSGDVSGLPLVGLAHVEQVQVGSVPRVLGLHGKDSASARSPMDRDYFRDLLMRTRDELGASLEPIRALLGQPQRDSTGEIAPADQPPAVAAAGTELPEPG